MQTSVTRDLGVQSRIINLLQNRLMDAPQKGDDTTVLSIEAQRADVPVALDNPRNLVVSYTRPNPKDPTSYTTKRGVIILQPGLEELPDNETILIRLGLILTKRKWGDNAIALPFTIQANKFSPVSGGDETLVVADMVDVAYDFLIHNRKPSREGRQQTEQNAARFHTPNDAGF